jgi:N-acetyl-beta-hexosaminidase
VANGAADRAEVLADAYPRLSVLAKVVSTPTDLKDYANFLNRLATHVERLRALDVGFRPVRKGECR